MSIETLEPETESPEQKAEESPVQAILEIWKTTTDLPQRANVEKTRVESITDPSLIALMQDFTNNCFLLPETEITSNRDAKQLTELSKMLRKMLEEDIPNFESSSARTDRSGSSRESTILACGFMRHHTLLKFRITNETINTLLGLSSAKGKELAKPAPTEFVWDSDQK